MEKKTFRLTGLAVVVAASLVSAGPGLAAEPSTPYFGVGLGVSQARDPLWQGQVDSPFDQSAIRAGESAGQRYDERVKRVASARAFVGIRRGQLAGELGYTAFGELTADTSREGGYGKATMGVGAWDASLLLYPLPSAAPGLFARLGMHRSSVEVQSHIWLSEGETVGKHSAVTNGALFGLGWDGGDWRVEWIRHSGVGLTDVIGKHEVDSIFFSLKF